MIIKKEYSVRKIVEKSVLGRAWVVDVCDESNNNAYATDHLVENILKRRGIVSPDDVLHFLNPSIKNNMPNPSSMRDMDVAARVIADSVLAHDKIAIYGDYDVDGITSTWLFFINSHASSKVCLVLFP